MEVKRAAVVGAGDMGHGIAELFAVGGIEVSLMDKYPEMLDAAKARIGKSLERLVSRGRLTDDQAKGAMQRITFTGSIAEAVAKADLIVEAVPESVELKKSVIAEICSGAPPGSIVASNTSNIMITELAKGVPRPGRVVGMHFFNPPMATKLVEVVPGSLTEPGVLDDVAEVSARLGRTPVKVLKDSPGFIVDRINAADTLLFCLILDKGIATAAEVDAYVRGQGLPMGVYELVDFVGVDVAADTLSYFAKVLSPEYAKGETYARMVKAKHLGKKSGKGFYDWVEGKAQVHASAPTDKISIMDIFAIEINEAVKLIEEGVARPEDIEKGMTLGMNRPFGPITVAKDLTNAEVRSKLEELAVRFDCKVFAPARTILDGKLRDAVEGRLSPGAGEGKQAAVSAPDEASPSKGGDVVRVDRLPGKVARIVLNRPRLNLINNDVLEALDRAVSRLSDDHEVRVVVVTGEGPVFSAGADLSQFFSSATAFMEFSRKGGQTMQRLAELPKLTMAVLKGYALGGGLELALACDLRASTEDVEVGFPEVSRGLIPAWSGSQRLSKLVGASQASSMILAGEKIKGRRAYEIGLIHRLTSPDAPDDDAIAYATELASTQAPVALMLAKRLMAKGSEVPMDVGLEMESMAAGVVFSTEDLREGASAFLGKRKPEFKGK